MKKINTDTLEEIPSRISPKGKFGRHARNVSEALGREPNSMDLLKRHPFDVQIARLTPGTRLCPYHSHSAQWEFYHVISGTGSARDDSGTTSIGPGDAFLFKPGEAHQIINDGTSDLVIYIIADNPIGETCYYPDSKKWAVRSPELRLIRTDRLLGRRRIDANRSEAGRRTLWLTAPPTRGKYRGRPPAGQRG